MIRQVVRDHAKVPSELGILEHMAPLAAVCTGGVLQQQGNPLTVLLEVDAILDVVDGHAQVASDRGVELRHAQPRSSSSSRRAAG